MIFNSSICFFKYSFSSADFLSSLFSSINLFTISSFKSFFCCSKLDLNISFSFRILSSSEFIIVKLLFNSSICPLRISFSLFISSVWARYWLYSFCKSSYIFLISSFWFSTLSKSLLYPSNCFFNKLFSSIKALFWFWNSNICFLQLSVSFFNTAFSFVNELWSVLYTSFSSFNLVISFINLWISFFSSSWPAFIISFSFSKVFNLFSSKVTDLSARVYWAYWFCCWFELRLIFPEFLL